MRYAKAFQPKEIDAFLSNLPAYSADEIAEIAKQQEDRLKIPYGTMLGMDALPPPGIYACICFFPVHYLEISNIVISYEINSNLLIAKNFTGI